jgi:hypothetical protein
VLLELLPVDVGIVQALRADQEFYLFQFLQEVFGVGIRGHLSNGSFLTVYAVQLSAFHENAYDARDLFFGDSQVKGSAAVDILRSCVCSEFLQ